MFNAQYLRWGEVSAQSLIIHEPEWVAPVVSYPVLGWNLVLGQERYWVLLYVFILFLFF